MVKCEELNFHKRERGHDFALQRRVHWLRRQERQFSGLDVQIRDLFPPANTRYLVLPRNLDEEILRCELLY
jgi:hypothetical protein